MHNYAEMYKGICAYNSVYNFFVYLLPSKSSVFAVHFSDVQTHLSIGRRHFQNMVLILR